MTKFFYKAIILLLLLSFTLLFVGNVMIEQSDISKLHVPAKLEVPESLTHAFIATEDKRFYHHNGLDYIAIVRASVENIKLVVLCKVEARLHNSYPKMLFNE